MIPTEYLTFETQGKSVAISDVEAMRDAPFEEQSERVRKLGFRLFVKRAKVGQSKHIRVRPRFDSWSLAGRIRVLVPEITWETLCKLFELAGRVGLCDWRPGCKTPGPYGMFNAKLERC